MNTKADGYTQGSHWSTMQGVRSAEMAHTEKLSFDRLHSGCPPSHTYYVHARAGLVHLSPPCNWSAYNFPRAGSLICTSKAQPPAL